MDFARRQMQKMGWTPGRGLGKKEDGIDRPLRLHSQQDSCGLGFDRTSSFNTHVWFANIDSVISAARNQDSKRNTNKTKTMTEEEGDVVVREEGAESDGDQNADGTNQRVGANKFYTQFSKPKLMLSTSLAGEEEDEQLIEKESKRSKKGRKRKNMLDLDQVYRMTKGATGHRSAHVGLKMSGKMRRLMEQEDEFRSS